MPSKKKGSSSSLPDMSSSSMPDMSISAISVPATPMPTPGSSKAPHFKGKDVNDFLKTLETRAEAARIPVSSLPSYVLQYCGSSVKRVIENNRALRGEDWDAVKRLLTDLYGMDDKVPAQTSDKLRTWVKKHREKGSITSLKDVNKYYRDFHSRSSHLLEENRLLESDADLLFFRGIPKATRKKIKKKLTPAQLKCKSFVKTIEILRLLRQEFDDDDADDSGSDSESDFSSIGSTSDSSDDSGSDSSDDDSHKKKRNKKFKRKEKKRKSGRKATGSDSDSDSEASNSDTSARKRRDKRREKGKRHNTKRKGEELTVEGNSSSTAVKPSIEEIIAKQVKEQLAVQSNVQSQQLQQASRPYMPTAPFPSNERRCFLCDKSGTHRLGIQFCTELPGLFKDDLVKYNEQGRLVRFDGSPLPRAENGSGGIAKILRDERMPGPSDKGKSRERNTQHTFTCGHVGLQYDGQDVLTDGTIGIATLLNEATAHPVTRQAKRNAQPDAQKTKNPIPVIPQQMSTDNSPTQQPTKEANHPSPIPPIINTELGWKNDKNRPRNVQDQKGSDRNTNGGYHFSSIIQEAIDSGEIQERILNAEVTLSVKEVLGISNDMQKRLGGLVKLKRVENTVKTSNVINFSPNDVKGLTKVSEGLWINTNERAGLPDIAKARFIPQTMQLSFDPSVDAQEFASKYACSAILEEVPNVLAWTTGRFTATFGGKYKVTFMVDSGSELNLISDSFFRKTDLVLEVDGVRWSLKGINGKPVPMVGLLRNVNVAIGGHRFDHHFFVSTEGTGTQQDVILGQPWLQWYSANLSYSRKGSILLRLWSNGDSDEEFEYGKKLPTIAIQLCTSDATKGRPNEVNTSRIEEVTDDSDLETGKGQRVCGPRAV